MNDYSENPMQCSMGVEEQADGKTYKFNLIFYFPDEITEVINQNYPFISDKFSYFISKAKFDTQEEASLYGSLMCDAVRVYVAELKQPMLANEILAAAMNEGTCPEEFKAEIRTFYDTHQEDDSDLHLVEDETEENGEPTLKKEDLN